MPSYVMLKTDNVADKVFWPRMDRFSVISKTHKIDSKKEHLIKPNTLDEADCNFKRPINGHKIQRLSVGKF